MEKKVYGEPLVQVERFDDVIVASIGTAGSDWKGDSTDVPGSGGDGDGSDM